MILDIQRDGRVDVGFFRLRRLIPIRYSDGRTDKIPSVLLNTMIEKHQIIEFKRKEGWVAIGVDAVRGMNHGQRYGKDRRCH